MENQYGGRPHVVSYLILIVGRFDRLTVVTGLTGLTKYILLAAPRPGSLGRRVSRDGVLRAP